MYRGMAPEFGKISLGYLAELTPTAESPDFLMKSGRCS
jgi:hypothetical protein